MNLFRELCERLGNALRAPFRPTAQSKYLCTLEEEVARLRAENRALLNSLLGTAGIPPLEIPGGDGATRPAAMPTRRRSWPQIAQSLEAMSRNTPARQTSYECRGAATSLSRHGAPATRTPVAKT